MQDVDALIELIRSGRNAEAVAVLEASPALATARSNREGQLHGASPLHWAAHRNATEVCHRLIAHGADFNRHTNTLRTPLDEAIDSDNDAVVTVLRNHGAVASKT